MKKFAKRAAALLLAVVLTFSLAGCYSEDMTWAAKAGNDTLPVGGYIYYLSSAYSEAAGMIDSEQKVLDSEVEGKAAKDWILDRADLYVKQYFWVNEEFERLGLEMTEEDYKEAANSTSSYWSVYGATFEPLGVAKSSFDLVYSQYNVKSLKLLQVLYGEGGEKEVSDDEITAYFADNYYNYEYFRVPTVLPNDEGEYIDLTEDEKAALKKELEDTQKQLEKKELTVHEAYEQYAKKYSEDYTYYSAEVNSLATFVNSSVPTELPTAVDALKDNEITVFETSEFMVLLKRLPIEDMFDRILSEEEGNRMSILLEMKLNEFLDSVKETAADFSGIEMNEKVLSRYTPKMLAKDEAAYGMLTAEEEAAEETADEE